MGFLEKKYRISDHQGRVHLITANHLYNEILKDSSSGYKCIASPRELVGICKSIGFPTEYALAIKLCILNHATASKHWANGGGVCNTLDSANEAAVYYCFNSLYSVSLEEAVLARKRFLTEMITSVSLVDPLSFIYHSGPAYTELRKSWVQSKYNEYIDRKNINFDELIQNLKVDFAKMIMAEEKNGTFYEDDRRATKR